MISSLRRAWTSSYLVCFKPIPLENQSWFSFLLVKVITKTILDSYYWQRHYCRRVYHSRPTIERLHRSGTEESKSSLDSSSSVGPNSLALMARFSSPFLSIDHQFSDKRLAGENLAIYFPVNEVLICPCSLRCSWYWCAPCWCSYGGSSGYRRDVPCWKASRRRCNIG